MVGSRWGLAGIALAIAAGMSSGGCADAASDRRADSPPISPRDSMVLAEVDSLAIGAPSGMAVDTSGNVYVADDLAGRVVRFDRQGRPTGTIGRKGAGPGELGHPASMTIVGDSLLIVLDVQRRQPYAFGLPSGSFRRAGRPLGMPVYVLSVRAMGDAVWMGFVDVTGGTATARWDLTTDTVLYRVPLPAEYRGTGLEYFQPLAHVLPFRDTVMVGLTGLGDLLVADSSGGVHGRLAVPVRLRRGIPADLAAIYQRDGVGENEVSILSLLWAMHRLSSGAIALIHLDITPGPDPPHDVRTDAYLTMLTPDGRRGCIDLPLPSIDGGRPVFAFRGDALWMLEQRVTADMRAELFVRVYALSDAACPVIS